VSSCSSISESTAIPMATMEFAALCLDNALLLLPEQSTAASATTASDGSTEQKFVFVSVCKLRPLCKTFTSATYTLLSVLVNQPIFWSGYYRDFPVAFAHLWNSLSSHIIAAPSPSSAVVLNHISSYFLIPCSDSSLICTVPVQ